MFEKLITLLDNFEISDAFTSEADLEEKLCQYLKNNDISYTSQCSEKQNRYDVICSDGTQKVCIELKVKAQSSDLEQFDRYMQRFPDGFIVLCWIASVPVREIFESVQTQSPTPVRLLELSKRYSIA